MKNKVMSPREAVQRYVQAGAHLSIGGFTIVRNPMGLVHEIIRQKIRTAPSIKIFPKRSKN